MLAPYFQTTGSGKQRPKTLCVFFKNAFRLGKTSPGPHGPGSSQLSGQAPFAAIVGCIDSRVPPELVFDQRLGSSSRRIAGNFVNTDIIGSLEFACKLRGAKAIVVLGHTDCGAIKGALDQAKLGNLTEMLKNIEPAITATKLDGERSSKDKKLVQAVADANAKLAAKLILDRSPILKDGRQERDYCCRRNARSRDR